MPGRRRHPVRRDLSSILLVIAMFGAVIGVLLGGELHFFSTPAESTVVEVIARHGARQGEGLPSHSYTVLLADRTTVGYESSRVWQVGDRLQVLYSRGRLTGRVLLSGPEIPIPREPTG